MELTIKSPTEHHTYLISPDIAKFVMGYLDNHDSESGFVVKIKGESLLER